MRSVRPPSGATWLLHKFGRNEALSGDLLEEYSLGRSDAWYWRQVLVAIVVGFGKEVRTHKLLALRAIGVGWAANYIILHVVWVPWWRFLHRILLEHGVSPVVWWRHYYLYPSWLICCIWSAACGWIVGRSHREHRAAMVLVYLLTVQLWLLPELLRLTVDVLENQRFLPYFLTCFVEFIFATVGILLGGLWDGAREQATPSNKSLFFRRVKKTSLS